MGFTSALELKAHCELLPWLSVHWGLWCTWLRSSTRSLLFLSFSFLVVSLLTRYLVGWGWVTPLFAFCQGQGYVVQRCKALTTTAATIWASVPPERNYWAWLVSNPYTSLFYKQYVLQQDRIGGHGWRQFVNPTLLMAGQGLELVDWLICFTVRMKRWHWF